MCTYGSTINAMQKIKINNNYCTTFLNHNEKPNKIPKTSHACKTMTMDDVQILFFELSKLTSQLLTVGYENEK